MAKTFLSLFVFCAGAAIAQPVSGGLKFGVPLTDAISVQSANPFDYIAGNGRFTIGPFVEVRLPANFGIEFDALYRSFSFSSSQSEASVGEWDFPLLLKYRFFSGPVRPYVDGGPVFNHLSAGDLTEIDHQSSFGVALGAGLDIHAIFLHVSPEIRYEGFALRNVQSALDSLTSNRNQVMVLVGVSF